MDNTLVMVYLEAIIFILSICLIAAGVHMNKIEKRLNEYDKYFKCLGIGMTIQEMQKKGMTKAKAPTCAPGGPEDYIKPPW